MPVTSVTLGPINPTPQPGQPISVINAQVNYVGTAPIGNGVITLYAQKADGTVVQVGVSQALQSGIGSNAVNFNNVDLAPVGEMSGVRFFAQVTQDTGTSPVTSGFSAAYDTVCFLVGTRIRTPQGDVAVESLRIGDLVMTADGRAEPVLFVGRQDFDTRFANREATYPVRIAAGALGDGLPAADLWLSPHHSLHIDGVLCFAKALVNGTTIAQMPPPEPAFSYFSIELDRHEVILAEGAEVESFSDNVPRTSFHNHPEFVALFPAGRQVGEMGLPVAKSWRQVPAAIRDGIAARAGVAERDAA